jgi:hypothetical protein
VDTARHRRWDEMLEEFRSLGGIADNICIQEGQFGRGLFPRDTGKPVHVFIPESLLIDARHMQLKGGDIVIDPNAPAGAREKAFLENYQRDFSWGENRQGTEELLEQFQGASPELRALAESTFGLDWWFSGPDLKSVASRYFGSRTIRYGEATVVMPIIELANHGDVANYEIANGIRLSGRFDGEILVRYEMIADALEMFKGWGFASPEDAAFSLGLGLEKAGIVIRREGVKPVLVNGVPFVPEVTAKKGKIELSHLLLGHKKFPRLAKGIFYTIARQARRNDPEALFDMIQHVNRTQFHRLMALSEDAPPRLGRLLRDVVRFQLDAMSNSIGTRDI